MFEDQNCKNFFHFDKFKMKKKKYVVLLLPFLILLAFRWYYQHNFVSLPIKFVIGKRVTSIQSMVQNRN